MNNKKQLIIIGVIIVVLAAAIFIIAQRNRRAEGEGGGASILPQGEVLPTIDSSVKVALTPTADKHEVTLAVSRIPSSIVSVEYDLTYTRLENGEERNEGIIGTAQKSEIKTGSYTKKFLLGTESSGARKYHLGVESVKVSIRFNGSDKVWIFEKEFEI